MDLVRGSVGVGGDVLEEHLRELASGVVRHVSVQAVAVGLGHLLLSAECREQSFRQGAYILAVAALQGPRTFRTRKLSGCPYIPML